MTGTPLHPSDLSVSPEELFRRRWLVDYSRFIGPPALVLSALVCHKAGWPVVGVLAIVAHIGFNLVHSAWEYRYDATLWRSWIRGTSNFITLLTFFASVGGVSGAWVLVIPTVFGAVGSPTKNQARGLLAASLAGFALGSVVAGVAPITVLTEWLALAVSGLATEYLYRPTIDGAVRAHDRAANLQSVNDDLAHALDVRKVFLATMSHEIRTPLNGVLGMAALLESTQLSQEQRKMVEVIRASGSGLLQVINDILDISKLEAGRMDVERVPTDVVSIVEQVIALLRHGDVNPAVAFRVLSEGVPRSLALDPTRIRQVLLNLIGNAYKFTSRGHIEVRIQWQDDTLSISVSDTGIGMSEDTLDRLFQPFSQADSATVRRFGGTGLGLSICKRLVELMGGTISAESTIGQGSVFHFTVRANVVARVMEAKVDTDVPVSVKVLVVDDHPVNRTVAAKMLERLGHSASELDSGVAALAYMENGGSPQVVLMDCQMPEMDGLETCRRLRARGWRLPIIAMTAGVTTEERDACRAAGMDDVLAKPVTFDSLRVCVQEWATRSWSEAADGVGVTVQPTP